MLKEIDKNKFAEAKIKVLGEFSENGGIGTLGEKSLHKILKFYIDPDPRHHEVELLGCVADVMNESGVFEIQTRNLKALRPKLQKMLNITPVTVVYPMPYEKYITLMDKESGEFISRRKSPKRSRTFDALYELYNLRDLLSRENLTVALVFLNVDEYRYIGGKHFGRKVRSTRIERIPNSIERISLLKTKDDYIEAFMPDGLEAEFSKGAYERKIGSNFKHGYSGVAILEALGILNVKICGRRKTYYLSEE